MKRNTFRLFLVAFSLLAVASTCSAAIADEASAKYTASDKFHRGVNNGLTGWLEAPVTVQKFHDERDLFEALTTGVTRGVGLAIARTGAGIYEIATFPFAVPPKYEPVIQPEKVQP